MEEEILMKKSKYSDAQIMAILKQAENGVPVADLCREHGMSGASFYKWRSKFGGMDASLMARMKELDEENKRLKKMYAEKRMLNDLLKEALGKKWCGRPLPGRALPCNVRRGTKARDGRMGGALSIRQHRSGLPRVFHQRDLLSVSAKTQR